MSPKTHFNQGRKRHASDSKNQKVRFLGGIPGRPEKVEAGQSTQEAKGLDETGRHPHFGGGWRLESSSSRIIEKDHLSFSGINETSSG